MKNTSQNHYNDLMKIESEIEDKLSDDNMSDHDANFFKALRTIIHLKIDSAELQHKFSMFHDLFTEMSIGNFDRRINIPNRKNLFSHMGTSLNAVLDELKVNVVKTQYVEASLEYIPHIAIITDKTGTIRYVNTPALNAFERAKEYLIDLRIANIFENKTQFGIENPDFSNFVDVRVKMGFFDKLIEVDLSVREIKDRLDQTDGYLYIGKLN